MSESIEMRSVQEVEDVTEVGTAPTTPSAPLTEEHRRFLNDAIRQITLVGDSADTLADEVLEATLDALHEAIFQQLNKILKGHGLSAQQKNEILANCEPNTKMQKTILRLQGKVEEHLRKHMTVPDNIPVPEFSDIRSTEGVEDVSRGTEHLCDLLGQAIQGKQQAQGDFKILSKVYRKVLESARLAGVSEEVLKEVKKKDEATAEETITCFESTT
uniref:Mediator complex subunit 11 n=1 Tax=Steinernema glaseri TaxID=37863 RepID=A0A1I7ZNR5_9BILA